MKYRGEAAYDHAAYADAGAGDVDGDGFDDLLVGARGNTSIASGSGANVDYPLTELFASLAGERVVPAQVLDADREVVGTAAVAVALTPIDAGATWTDSVPVDVVTTRVADATLTASPDELPLGGAPAASNSSRTG